MQQRRPRLGDILDDYCPRERRITNHAVVAMIDDEVKQTRCTTCDADHEYKEARIPPQRRKRPEDGAADPALPGRLRPTGDDMTEDDALEEEVMEDEGAPPLDQEQLDADGAPDDMTGEDDARVPEDDGPVHRRLIRATLPRQEGQVPERKEPEFTIRQPGMRGPDGRKGGGGGGRGRRPMRGPQQGGGWQGQGQSPRQGSGFGHGQPRQGGGGSRQGGAPGNRGQGTPGGPRGNRQGPPSAGGRGGGRKRGR